MMTWFVLTLYLTALVALAFWAKRLWEKDQAQAGEVLIRCVSCKQLRKRSAAREVVDAFGRLAYRCKEPCQRDWPVAS